MNRNNMAPVKKEKARIRAEIAAEVAKLDVEYLRESDVGILAALLTHPYMTEANTLFCYVSVGREPDTRRFLEAMMNAGKRVCVPLCKDGGEMEARHITTLAQLHPAPFGLLEPGRNAPLVSPEQIDLVVAPCVCAGRDRRRLGHGAGYYDRFLAAFSRPILCLCRETLLREGLPVDETDVLMDRVITENAVY